MAKEAKSLRAQVAVANRKAAGGVVSVTQRGFEVATNQLPLAPLAGYADAFAIADSGEFHDIRFLDTAAELTVARVVLSKGDVVRGLLANLESFREQTEQWLTDRSEVAIPVAASALQVKGVRAVPANLARVGRLGHEAELGFYHVSVMLIAEARALSSTMSVSPLAVVRVSTSLSVVLGLVHALQERQEGHASE